MRFICALVMLAATATPIPPSAAQVLAPTLASVAAREASGMKPEGALFAGQFQDGQTLEQPIALQPGKCYTFIAVGMGVTDVEMKVSAQPAPMMPPSVITSDGHGSTAIVGGKSVGCYKIPPQGSPWPGMVVLKAVHGAGIIGAQVYVK